MVLRNVRDYFYVIIGGLVILAGILLVALNWAKSTGEFSVYGKVFTVNLALLILFSAIGGIVFHFIAKLFLKGALGIYRARREKDKIARLVAVSSNSSSKDSGKSEAKLAGQEKLADSDKLADSGNIASPDSQDL